MKEEIGHNGKEKCVAFVVARLSSSRLPGKHFRQIGDRPLIQWVTGQLLLCGEIDEIVIATVAEQDNEPLVAYAKESDLSLFCYEGEVDHVTTRLRRAAEVFNADICVLVSGDCPLIHHSGIDAMVSCMKQSPEADVVFVEEFQGVSTQLQGINVARKRAWQLADEMSDRPELKEHQFPVIGMKPQYFNLTSCVLPENLYAPPHRLSVDTMADLEFQNRVFRELAFRQYLFDLPRVLSLLKEKPELTEINAHVHHRRLIEDIKQILFIVDAGKGYGYGHLMRSLELAGQMVERLSYPITFVLNDESAVELAETAGFRVVRGGMDSPSGKLRFRSGTQDSEKLFDKHDLVILDIHGQRTIHNGWRGQLSAQMPVVVLDVTEPWAREADMVVVPGVTCSSNSQEIPRLKTGRDRVILRREVRAAQDFSRDKDLDVIAYLHNEHQRSQFRSFADQYHLNVHISEGLEKNFPENMARSRFLLSGFGYSFYEAVALGTFPVAWPLSRSHRQDALVFYRNMELPAAVVNGEDDLKQVLYPLCKKHEMGKVPFDLTDGTPLIIQDIHELLNRDGGYSE